MGSSQGPRQHLIILARAERPRTWQCAPRGVSSMPGPRWGEVEFPEQAAAAAIIEVGAARPLGAQLQCQAPTLLPDHPARGLREASCPHGLASCLVGDGDHTTRPIPAVAGRGLGRARKCWAVWGVHPARWATSEHTGLCHPRNVFDQDFLPRGASPGLLIRSHSPGGLPPCPAPHRGPADNSQGTVGGWLWAWALRPTSGGIVTAPHKEDGEENSTASPPLMAAGREPIQVGSVH